MNCLPIREKISKYLPVYASLLVFVQACKLAQIIILHLLEFFFSFYRCGYAPDCPDSCGSTPLMDALHAGHVLVAETLINEHKVQELVKEYSEVL